jgi:hypothetical protein
MVAYEPRNKAASSVNRYNNITSIFSSLSAFLLSKITGVEIFGQRAVLFALSTVAAGRKKIQKQN